MARILVVDDDRDFQQFTRVCLESVGHEIEAALTPDDGIAKVQAFRPDLVILDVMMPDGYEGFSVARTIREELGLRELPIVILSAVHQKKDVPYRFGPDDDYLPVDTFMDKPVSPAELLETVGRLLGSGGCAGELDPL